MQRPCRGRLLWFMLNNGIQDMRELEKYRISEITRRVRMKPVYVYSTIEDLILLSMDQNFVPVIDGKNSFIGLIKRNSIIQFCYDQYKNSLRQEPQVCMKISCRENEKKTLTKVQG
mgnify:FL=1